MILPYFEQVILWQIRHGQHRYAQRAGHHSKTGPGSSGDCPGSQVTFRSAADGSIVVEKADPTGREPSRFAKARGSAGPGMTTDERMALLRGEPE
jgi:antitoxin PrlF